MKWRNPLLSAPFLGGKQRILSTEFAGLMGSNPGFRRTPVLHWLCRLGGNTEGLRSRPNVARWQTLRRLLTDRARRFDQDTHIVRSTQAYKSPK